MGSCCFLKHQHWVWLACAWGLKGTLCTDSKMVTRTRNTGFYNNALGVNASWSLLRTAQTSLCFGFTMVSIIQAYGTIPSWHNACGGAGEDRWLTLERNFQVVSTKPSSTDWITNTSWQFHSGNLPRTIWPHANPLANISINILPTVNLGGMSRGIHVHLRLMRLHAVLDILHTIGIIDFLVIESNIIYTFRIWYLFILKCVNLIIIIFAMSAIYNRELRACLMTISINETSTEKSIKHAVWFVVIAIALLSWWNEGRAVHNPGCYCWLNWVFIEN